jgi:hypothetical protein
MRPALAPVGNSRADAHRFPNDKEPEHVPRGAARRKPGAERREPGRKIGYSLARNTMEIHGRSAPTLGGEFGESPMRQRNHRRACAVVSIALAFVLLASGQSKQEHMTDVQRDVAPQMLQAVRDAVKTSYYDPKFHNVDFEARYLTAKEKVKQAGTLSEVHGITAWMLEVLDDSHTFFIPPARPYMVENGWRMRFVGDRCFVTAVKPESDAQAQGLKPGDQLLSMEGFALKRDTAWKLQYAFEVLAPRSATRIVSASPNGQPRELLVKAGVEKMPKAENFGFDQWYRDALSMSTWRMVDMGDPLMIWKMPGFKLDDREVDRFIAAAKKHQALILDLRGNPGGAEPTLVRMLGSFLDHDARIGDRVGRGPAKPFTVKTRGSDKVFSGKLAVLIDSQSASAAEMFSRVIQMEKRGVVLGDRSSGSVM